MGTLKNVGTLAGKISIVTGGAGGIGRAIGEVLAGEGSSVVLADISAPALADVVDELRATGLSIAGRQVDLADATAVRAMVASVTAEFGRLDILVNNAGISPKADGERLAALDLDPQLFRRIVDVNLSSVFFCSVEAARAMRATGGGTIVNVGSLAARVVTGNASAPYAASKGAVESLSRTLAIEFLQYGIRVNTISPGRVQTPITAAASPEFQARAASAIPIGRLADPHEIARAVLYLASDASSFIVGATLDVSGGRSIV